MKGQSVHYKVLAFRILSSFAEMICCDQNPFFYLVCMVLKATTMNSREERCEGVLDVLCLLCFIPPSFGVHVLTAALTKCRSFNRTGKEMPRLTFASY